MPKPLILLAGIAMLFAACANPMVSSTGVTPLPVDSVPADILASYDSSFGAPDDVLYVTFRTGTTLQQKAAAIAGIGGRVVGGVPGGSVAGYYVVRFPSKGVEASLLPARNQLLKNPAVVAAMPLSIFRTPGDVRERSDSARTLSDAETVTELPPDSMPVYAYTTNMDPAAHASRDIVVVLFNPGTSLENKRRVVASINGRVVGGVRSSETYAIRISRNSTNMSFADKTCDRLFEDQSVTTCMRLAIGGLPRGPREPA